MISPALARRAQELAAARESFVTATVVRVQHPTSAEAGRVALVLGDGTIEGFVGGVCAEQSVRAYSLLALESGEPVLLRILPEAPEGDVVAAGTETAELTGGDGAVTVRNPCLSGGAIEVFLEPAPAPPRVLVAGDTPIAEALRRIGGEVGLDFVDCGEGGPEPGAGDLGLVVASHGRDELQPLRRGLEAGLPYVGLVASDRRGAGVIEELRAGGVPENQLELIDVPAGLPIGARDPAEIALSILARIVSVRRGATDDDETGRTPPASGPATLAVDPVCGMSVAAVASTPSLSHQGETVYFCGEGCRAKFQAQHEHAGAAN